MNEASGIVPAPAIIPPPMRAFLSRRNGPSPDQIIPSFDETVRSGIREIVEFKIVLGWQLSNCGFFLENQRQFFQFCNVLPVLINHLLPSFGQHRNPTFVKLVVFISKTLNQVRFDIIIVIEIFTIRGVL